MKKNNYILSYKKGLFWSSFLLGLFFSTYLQATNINTALKQQEDSLLNILAHTPDLAQKIGVLRNLTTLSKHTEQEVIYSRQMLEIANRIDSIHCSYEAISYLCRYYCNTYELDSISYWVNTIDSIAAVHNEVPDELFSVHNALCRLYIIRRDFEMAMNEAVKQQIMSEKSNYLLGLVSCNENWGLIYMITNRFEEAAQAFEDCISILKKIDDQYVYILQVNECLIQTYLYLKEYQKAEEALDYYDQIINQINADNKVKFNNNPINEYIFILETYRTRLYSEMNMPEKALKSIKRLTPYKEVLSKPYIPPVYNLAMANYYYAIKDYPQALNYINKPVDQDIPYFELKAAILTGMGKKREVLGVYQQYMELGKSQRESAFMRQISQLNSLQKLKEEENTVQSLALQEKELQNKLFILWGLIILSFVLLFSLSLWIWYLIWIRKLKNTLVNKQIILKETNHNLQIAKEKAENAERMKSNFIANISHEIRTPLNTIVGFAGMLEDTSQEEQKKYIQIINNSSDLLLNLVSDVLNLSGLSDTDFVLNIQQVNLEECCQYVLSTVKHCISADVKTVFTHPEKPFVIDTDPLRLQQLLVLR